PADPGEFALARELGSNGDGVGGFAPAVQVDDRVIDRLVRGTVEITSPQHFNDIGDRVLGEHHPTEHTLFRGNVLRRSPIELRCAWSGQVSGAHSDPFFQKITESLRAEASRCVGVPRLWITR